MACRGVFFLLLILIAHLSAFSQRTDKTCKQATLIVHTIRDYHYSPLPLDDSLSNRVFGLFLESMDPEKVYLTQQDFDKLSVHRYDLDEMIVNGNCQMINELSNIYWNSLTRATTIINKIAGKPFDFASKNPEIFSDSLTHNYAISEKELETRWRLMLKQETLAYLFQVADGNQPERPSNTNLLEHEPEIRKKASARALRKIKWVMQHESGYENYLSNLFLNALANAHDPHTTFFDDKAKSLFEASLSSEAYSYGFDLEENNNGSVKVARVLPGSPAWRSNALNKGDILLKIELPNGTQQDISFATRSEIEAILLPIENSKKVTFTVRKANGKTQSVNLHKEKLRADENLIKSFILKGSQNIGYISLPGFYTEWGNTRDQRSAADMAKEIIKLKRQNIDGLILDLRYNGGGSMQEAIELAGIFIHAGPIAVTNSSGNKPTIVKDPNLGTSYDGKLIILVNGLSASASEVVAGALQDYNRAIIVGSPTYGKATSQIVLPLASSLNLRDPNVIAEAKRNGYLKTTFEKIYRVTGETHQRKGVIPDIMLPSIFDAFDYYKEASQPYTVDGSGINKDTYYRALPVQQIHALNAKSKERVSGDTSFQAINDFIESFPVIQKQLKTVTLEIDAYRDNTARLWKQIEALMEIRGKKEPGFTVENTDQDQEILAIDDYGKEINETLKMQLQTDIYVQEAFQILKDYIDLK